LEESEVELRFERPIKKSSIYGRAANSLNSARTVRPEHGRGILM
jgi:hypothetical protein